MTDKQKEAYDFIREFCDHYGIPPSYDNIAEGLKISKTAAYSRCKPFRKLIQKLKTAAKS
jgi:SOS-response transcriptional repressor LexA